MQVIKLGQDLTLVATGSEEVLDYAFYLKREMAATGWVWVSGYSDDYNGYIPSLRVLKEGGYEVDASWGDSVEERIAAKVHELHRRVSE